MEKVQLLNQAYAQAPWRKQLQIIGLVCLFFVLIALVADIYLNITARAATIGREIQAMQVRFSGMQRVSTIEEGEPDPLPIEELEQVIASLEAELAYQTSYDVMEGRAANLGFQPASTEELVYLEIEGYVKANPAEFAPPPVPMVIQAENSNPLFKESLLDWLKLQIVESSRWLKEIQR
jgi:hypothetical protein